MFCNIKYQDNQIQNKELFQSEEMKCFILKHLGGKLSQIFIQSTQFWKDLLELFFPLENNSIPQFFSD